IPSGGEWTLASAYIDELEPDIVSLDQALALLSQRRAALAQSLHAHKSIISPLRRLPPEILGEIFSFAVHAAYYFGDISEVSGPISQQAPWVLTRVCRRWAAVALATPALW
ncbi:hypothetical protein B0H17DRAFT_910311, partial [Mycena rosella]